MAPHATVTLPTTRALPSSLRIPSTDPWVSKILGKLSRSSLLAVVEEWLKDQHHSTCAPYLGGEDSEDEDLYNIAQSTDEVREVYSEFEKGKGAKREVLDRVLEGDWRHGISLQQLAMADLQYLVDHPTSHRWTALKLVRLLPEANDISVHSAEKDDRHLPRFHAPSFLRNLQSEVGALVKAHYHLSRLPSMPITLLRMQIHDSPYTSQGSRTTSRNVQALDISTTIYVAFPDDTPFVYVSLVTPSGSSSGGNNKTIRKAVIDAIPKAFSKPLERYGLKATSLSARSVSALVAVRGSTRGNSAAGGWSIFAEGSVEGNPLQSTVIRNQEYLQFDDKENLQANERISGTKRNHQTECEGNPLLNEHEDSLPKRRQHVALSRFGKSGVEADGKGIERLDIRIEDPFTSNPNMEGPEPDTSEPLPDQTQTSLVKSRRGRRPTLTIVDESDDETISPNRIDSSGGWIPTVQLSFHGAHVFAGIRKLLEVGVVNGEKMPSWMTGEDGVSVGVVQGGRIKGMKGSGI
ncbi:MAG: hypothetical protein Q9187_005246 [Circinaria calcarea]